MNSQTESNHTVLIVDDSADNRNIFRFAVELKDYVVTEAEDGWQALEILRDHTFNLMLLDLHMPRMNGDKVLETLRQDERHKGMRVVILTAEAHRATAQVQELADFIMNKPVNMDEFIRFVGRLRQMS